MMMAIRTNKHDGRQRSFGAYDVWDTAMDAPSEHYPDGQSHFAVHVEEREAYWHPNPAEAEKRPHRVGAPTHGRGFDYRIAKRVYEVNHSMPADHDTETVRAYANVILAACAMADADTAASPWMFAHYERECPSYKEPTDNSFDRIDPAIAVVVDPRNGMIRPDGCICDAVHATKRTERRIVLIKQSNPRVFKVVVGARPDQAHLQTPVGMLRHVGGMKGAKLEEEEWEWRFTPAGMNPDAPAPRGAWQGPATAAAAVRKMVEVRCAPNGHKGLDAEANALIVQDWDDWVTVQ